MALPLFFLSGRLIVLFGDRYCFTGDAVLIIDPTAKVDQLAVFGAKGTVWIVLPLDRLFAVRTFHENNSIRHLRHSQFPEAARDLGLLTRIFRLMKSIVPSRRMAFKRTVTLSRVEPTIAAISR